jgi:hypothetical protein
MAVKLELGNQKNSNTLPNVLGYHAIKFLYIAHCIGLPHNKNPRHCPLYFENYDSIYFSIS